MGNLRRELVPQWLLHRRQKLLLVNRKAAGDCKFCDEFARWVGWVFANKKLELAIAFEKKDRVVSYRLHGRNDVIGASTEYGQLARHRR